MRDHTAGDKNFFEDMLMPQIYKYLNNYSAIYDIYPTNITDSLYNVANATWFRQMTTLYGPGSEDPHITEPPGGR